MVDKKVTTMVLKVDLQCHRCNKKVKKVLSKFSQIQEQVYDDNQNTVTIKVVCCCPEKIKKKIICKGGGAIKEIEIKNPEKPKPDVEIETEESQQEPKPPKDETQPGKNSGPEATEKEGEQCHASPPHCAPSEGVRTCCGECYGERGGGPCQHGQPLWPWGEPYYGGYCGGPRPVCGEYYVVGYECPQQNYGPCRIM